MFDDYLESANFLKHKFYQINRREIILSFDKKIKSKENTSQNKRNIIKKDINQHFIDIRRKAFTSKIYLRIVYYYNDSNPPTVVNATKNMLDLMHVNVNQQNSRENIGVIRTRLPYYDDSQVSFLSVRQYIETDSACSYVHIDNFNNVLQYANILSRLEKTNSIDNNDQDDDIDFMEQINDPVGSLGYKIEMYQRQQSILKTNQVKPFYLELLYNHNKYKKKGNGFVDILLPILKYPIRVVVTIPKNKNEIVEQKKLVKKKLSQFKKQNPFFKFLYGPITLSVFYRPKKEVGAKDIDNYIREIISPCFESEFKPPSRMFDPTKEELTAIKAADYRSNLNGHIMGYDILKLPNDDKHNANEEICIIGFHMECHSDVIGSLKEEIEEIIDSV